MDNNNKGQQESAGSYMSELVGAVLLLLVAATAIAVVYSSHQSRQLFSELQVLKREGLVLQEEWGRLLLERSTWSSHDRIQQLATDQLSMVVPSGDALRMVTVDGKEG